MSETMGESREPVFSGRRPSSFSSTDVQKGAITRDGPVGGASTGSPAAPTAATSSNYHRERSRYNVSTGSGFNPPPKEGDSAGTTPGPGANAANDSSGETGIKGTLAGIYGAGESFRGTVNAAIDSAFNDQKGVSKNQAIAREGEWEFKTGQFSKSTKERERFGRSR